MAGRRDGGRQQYNAPMRLPNAIHSAAQVRALDEHEIHMHGTSGYTLMKRAAEASLRMLRFRWPMARTLVVVCGAGNNGGDGFVLARFARAAGLGVRVLAVVDPRRLVGDAALAWQDCVASAVEVEPFGAQRLADADVVVDAGAQSADVDEINGPTEELLEQALESDEAERRGRLRGANEQVDVGVVPRLVAGD